MNPRCVVGGADLSEQVDRFNIAEKEVKIRFRYDFDNNLVNTVLWPIYQSGLPFLLEIDEFSRWCLLREYESMAGIRGDLSDNWVTFVRFEVEN